MKKMASILVIDDNTQMCDLMTEILKTNGYLVRVAHDGIEGIKLYHEQRPDLVLTDVIMPNQDGIHMLIELKQIDKEIPIIVMSGDRKTVTGRITVTAELNLTSAELLGVNTTLHKPFTNKQLLDAVRIALNSI